MDDEFREGDDVLLVEGERSFIVKIDGSIAKMKGSRGGISTSRLIGSRPGGIITIGTRSFFLLRPDMRDRIENIERGPQIIIPKDASHIITGLGLTNGSRVVEGGAGSGGLTLFLLNSVMPEGRVWTYDIREDHLKVTADNVRKADLSAQWEGKLGDVRYGVDEKDIDAVVLDVPEPELAVESLSRSIRQGGRFCSYVPTTNQLERVVLALRRHGFVNVEALEIVVRPYSVKEGATRPVTEILSHTGFLVFARWLGSP
ncbi:MAG: tRNA (adenine-N1)-methyltransferase [Thermoplasmatota archaeon]